MIDDMMKERAYLQIVFFENSFLVEQMRIWKL